MIRKPTNLPFHRLSLWVIVLFTLAQAVPVAPVDAQSGIQADCPPGGACLYLPLLANRVSFGGEIIAGDIVLEGLEITQAVQDSNNSVPLVAGRNALLRIFAHVEGLGKPLPEVQVAVSASSEVAALSSTPSLFTVELPMENQRDDLGTTLNVTLPSAWLDGSVSLTVQLDPANRVHETNEENNSKVQLLTFQTVPPLDITVVPIQYTHTPNQRTYPAPAQDSISDWILRAYPVSRVQIRWHAPYSFTGDLRNSLDFSRLLNEVTTLRASEGAPASRVYYGLIPVMDGSSTWFYGGVAGVGWVGLRSAVGLNTSYSAGQIAAHEIGHNLGLWHTPCGSPSGTDPNYPYPGGSIGQVGVDVRSGQLYRPDNTSDLMSYCNPKWISDYTYRGLFNAQLQSAGGDSGNPASGAGLQEATVEPAAIVTQPGLLVRAMVAGGQVHMLPAYLIPDAPAQAPEPGDYLVEVLDRQGQALVQAPVRAYAVEDNDAAMQGIYAVIPLPGSPAGWVRLLKDGQVLAEQALPDGEQTAPLVTTDEEVQAQGKSLQSLSPVPESADIVTLQWDDRGGLPALVRYSPDGGTTWTTLAVDALGGQFSVPVSILQGYGDPESSLFEVILTGS